MEIHFLEYEECCYVWAHINSLYPELNNMDLKMSLMIN
jgi:hypothetical protein